MKKRDIDDGIRTERSDLAYSRGVAGVEIGHEPPLDTSGSDAEEIDRRGVNLRWLGASVLTGITGGALIGASIYIALEGVTSVAQKPERAVASTARPVSNGDKGEGIAKKADKLIRAETVASAKQGFRAPMTIRAADREVIKVRQFVRVATSLSLTAGTYATDIPPFNPLRFFAEDNGERFVEPAPEVSDADVSVIKRDLTALAIDPGAPTLSDEDVAAQLEEERRMSSEIGRRATVPIPAQLMLSRTLRQPHGLPDALGYAGVAEGLFNSIEVRVVPENVTNLSKLEPRGPDALIEERDLVLKKGETLEAALRANGATPDQVQSILATIGTRVRLASIPEGQRVRILIGPGPRTGDGKQIVRVILFGERGIEAIAATNDRGVFVSVTPPVEDAPQRAIVSSEDEEEDGDDGGGVRLYESLYETALKNDLPRNIVEELVRVFGYDVDFQRRVSPGDGFEIFYALDDENGERPEVLYAALTLGGEARRIYRFQGEDGSVDYFDELGRSLKKFLLRKPIAEGMLRSGFGMRRHPILGYSKMHTGVDWANRIGTPIVSAGVGTVIKAEWDSGYGRRVEVQHANGYVTAYSHMSRFGKGIAPGAKVRQGQVIGYVGNTGLSTGPHLHYEVIVNGHFVDPMKIRVPRGRELDGRALAEFKRQREQVDSLMERAGHSSRLAQRTETR